MRFTELPQEVIEGVLICCDPLDVAQVAQCCQPLRSIIYGSDDSTLWRSLYLAQPLDDPRECVAQDGTPRVAIDWRGELQRIARARTVALNALEPKRGEYAIVLQTLLDLVTNVPPMRATDYSDISHNLPWVAAILSNGFLSLSEEYLTSEVERERHARLHTYYGLTRDDTTKEKRVASRAFVYDMRNYRMGNSYGPFTSQGCVVWRHVQALHHVMAMHLVDLEEGEQFGFAVFQMSLPFTQISIPRGVCLDTEDDWADITGCWTVSFCFCDHRELLAYNESADEYGELETWLFEDPEFREVFRSLEVEIKVERTIPDPKYPTRPIIFFKGVMKDPSTSQMRGRITMTPDKQVRWDFTSGEQNNALWSSVGIQIGGLRSSFGVLGSWTTVFHEHDDPVGPFWLRKTRSLNEINKVQPESGRATTTIRGQGGGIHYF